MTMQCVVLGGRGFFTKTCDCLVCSSRSQNGWCLVGQVAKRNKTPKLTKCGINKEKI